MKPRISIHEELARSVKAGKLLAAVDQHVGYRTGDQAEGVAEFLESLDDEDWQQLADVAHCNPPSERTRQRVIELVRARASRAA